MPRVVEVSCSITQRSSRREMRPFFYCEYPAQLLANMIRLVVVDNAWEDSFSFSSLRDKVVVAMGIDKSDLDLIQTIRVCNRKKGNASICVQALACLLGPAVQEYSRSVVFLFSFNLSLSLSLSLSPFLTPTHSLNLTDFISTTRHSRTTRAQHHHTEQQRTWANLCRIPHNPAHTSHTQQELTMPGGGGAPIPRIPPDAPKTCITNF